MGDFFFGVWGGGGRGIGLVGAGSVVVATAGGVGKGVVCVVYLLEFLGPRRALRGVGGATVGVGFEGLSSKMGLARLLEC